MVVPKIHGTARYSEGQVDTISTGNNDDAIDLAKGTTSQILEKVKIMVPGGVGDITVTFYNGSVASGTAITGALYLAAQPDEGFDMGNTNLSSGTLGWRLAGRTSGGTKSYTNVKYRY